MKWTVFDYLYRDAGNHKAFGCVVLEGRISETQHSLIVQKFDDGAYFVAEQLDIPVLYDQLYRWSSGSTADDHCWHEWLDFREVEEKLLPKESYVWGTVNDFLAKLDAVEFWEGELSPHFYIGYPIHEMVAERA